MRRFPLAVWGFALLLAILTSLPYAVGAMSTPDGWAYSGAATLPEGAKVDYNSHMAKMWQGARGEFDYHLLFTHEDHAGLLTVQGFYVTLGAFAGLTSLDFAFTYHLARFILTLIMVLTIWAFMSRYLETIGERWAGTFFATIVLGWSWILFFVAPDMVTLPERAPIELWLFDAYNLLGAFIMPHFAAVVILQIIAFLTFDSWLKHPQAKYILILTIVLFVDAIIQPYVVLMTFPTFGIMTAHAIFIKRNITIRQALWLIFPALAHGGIVLFQFAMIANDPIWTSFTAQNQTLSPPPYYYVLGYLPLLLPIALGWRHIISMIKNDDRWLLPIVWIAVVMLLLYAPFPTQRRYLLGVQTPLALLAGLGWYRVVLIRITESWRPFANIPYLSASGLALVMVLVGNTVGLINPSTESGVFYTRDELLASAWIQANTEPDSLILTTFDWDTSGSGGKVVALTGRRVYAGHWIETADFDNKRNQLAKFYDSETTDEWRQSFLSTVGVDVIWYDESVRAFGDWQPADANYLAMAFMEPVQLYVVLKTE